MKASWIVLPQCTGDYGQSEIDTDQVAVGPFANRATAEAFSKQYCFDHAEVRPMLPASAASTYSERAIFGKEFT